MSYTNTTNQGENPATPFSAVTQFGYYKHVQTLERYFPKEVFDYYSDVFRDGGELEALAYAFARIASDIPTNLRPLFAKWCVIPIKTLLDDFDIEDGYFGEAVFENAILGAFDRFICRYDLSTLDSDYEPITPDEPSLGADPSAGFFERMYIRRITEGIFARLQVDQEEGEVSRPTLKPSRARPVMPMEIVRPYDWTLLHEHIERARLSLLDEPSAAQFNSGYARAMALRRIRKAQRLADGHVGRQQGRGARVARESAPVQPRLQSGHSEGRKHREELQRKAAAAKKEQERKSAPKAERLKAVKSQRDKRNVAFQSGMRPSVIGAGVYGPGKKAKFVIGYRTSKVQYQSGLPVAIGVAAIFGVTRAVGGLVSLFKKAGNAADAGADLATSIRKKLEGFGVEFKKHLGKSLWAIPLVMTCFYALHRLISKGPIVPLLIGGALSLVIGPQMWNVCAKFFQGSTVQLQSGVEESGGFGGLLSKLTAAIFTFSAFAGRKSHCVSEFMKRMSMIEKFSGGLDTFCGWLVKSFEFAINAFRALLGKDKINLLKEQHGPLKQWMRRVDEIVCKDVTKGGVTPEDLDLMVHTIHEGYQFKEVYRGTRVCLAVDSYLSKIASALMPYQGALQARNNFRFEPSMLMMCGEPGVGKTRMAPEFCCAVLKLSGIVAANATAEQTLSQIWQKGNSEFWNGYAGQECMVIDDCFQQKADKTDKENEYMTAIRMVSSWAFPLNFADLASKGKIYFGSKFVFGTTNLYSIDSEARQVIQEPEAVLRRMKYSVRLRVKPGFSLPDGKLNYPMFLSALQQSSVENAGTLDAFPWHVWEVAPHNYSSGTLAGEWYPLKDLLLEVSRDLKSKFRTHADNLKSLTSFIDGLTPLDGEIQFQSGGSATYDAPGHLQALDVLYRDDLADAAECVRLWELAFGFLRGFAIAFVLVNVLVPFVKFVFSSIFGFFGGITKKIFRKKELQSNLPRGARPVRQAGRNKSKIEVKVPASVKAGDVKLQGPDESVCNNIYANSYKLYARLESGSGMVLGQVIFLQDRLAMQPVHFTRDIERMLFEGSLASGQCVVFRNAVQPQFEFAMSADEYLSMRRSSLESAEVEFLEFTVGRAHRNIVSNFVRENDVKYLGGHPVRLDVCSIDNKGAITSAVNRRVFVSNHLAIGKKLKVAGRSVDRYLQYQAATESGDCGAPLCVLNPSRFSGRVCAGFHFAGTNDGAYGYSTIVSQEMIEKAISDFKCIVDNFEEDCADRGIELHSSNELPFVEGGSFLPLYTVDRPANICPKSSYFMTSEYGCIGDYSYRPARLSPVFKDGEWVYPMCNAVKPYSSPLLHYEQPWLKQAVYIAMQPLFKVTANRDRRVYSFEEAVKGVAEEKFRSIPRATSAGYPYVLDHKNGKKDFFGEGVEYDLTGSDCAELETRTKKINWAAENGKRLAHIFLDFMKDELRSPEKVEAVATRLISAAPLDYTVSFRQYFAAISAAAMSVPIKCGMAPGINCFGDWDALGTKLQSMGPDVFDGDFKAFDSSEQPCIHDLILDEINRWYDDGSKNAMARKVLWLELTHSRHIGGRGFDQKNIYQWNKSLPSGHPFTTIVNSIYSLVLLVGAYIQRTGDWSGFWDNVSAVTYGDDNVVNVSPEYTQVYNQATVSETLAEQFQVKYTPGNKSTEFQTDMRLEDVTFLKRRFREERGRWLCPLELDSFLYTAYWCKNGRLVKDIIRDDWENALEELSMHPPRLWDEYAPLILKRLEYSGSVSRYIPQREAYLDAVLRRTDEWY